VRQVDLQPEQRTELESANAGLEIAHVSGRRPAVLASVVVIGALIAMVWVGMSGRTNPSPAPTLPAVAEVPTLSPSPTDSPASPSTLDPEPDSTASPSNRGPEEVYGVYAQIGDVQYITILSEPEPGHLFGRLRVPLPLTETDGTFVFQQFASREVRGQPVAIADWPINVDALAADSPLFLAVNATLPPRRTIQNAPRPVERGYHLTVTGQRRGEQGELTINVSIGPNRQLQGNDGILGWAVVSQLRKPKVDRTRGRYNYCRWDVGAMAARPKPGTDESDCQG
jgi:hypothetical protein